ncbi:MAG: hypothetical protein KatS3mg105_4533 [Gemmatales bacterium]|nr:MAG: hypothetical protein KatS3mg105_4533 [Gemmatales bacterium]
MNLRKSSVAILAHLVFAVTQIVSGAEAPAVFVSPRTGEKLLLLPPPQIPTRKLAAPDRNATKTSDSSESNGIVSTPAEVSDRTHERRGSAIRVWRTAEQDGTVEVRTVSQEKHAPNAEKKAVVQKADSAPADDGMIYVIDPYATCTDFWVAPRFSARKSFGDGVGYDNGYTYIEGFLPFRQVPGSSLWFANSRVVNYDHGEFWEFQVGGGRRVLLPNLGVVTGMNGFYDGRNSDIDFYHQLGFGWEVLGAIWEWRGNVYIPVGPQRFLASDTGFFNPQFVGTNISLDRLRIFESSMNGVDTELGRTLVNRDWLNLRGYVGFYHYSNDQVRTANGIRGRLEAWVNERMSFNLAVQNDGVFDTTVTGGLALHFGGLRRGARNAAPLQAKLGNRVVRDPNVVLQRTQEFRRELAIDPTTGNPIEVRHVSSNAAAGGDGSVEHPFQTLSQLQNGSSPGQILFVHANSNFNGQAITLQDNQRFLGEGLTYTFVSRQGTFRLPRATTGTNRPVIQNSTADAITLANNNEVANFSILNSGNDGIQGVGINNFNIHDNLISGSARRGIRLISTTGTGFIQNNTIQNNMRSGIRIRNQSGTSLNVTIANNTVTGNSSVAGAGISIIGNGNSQITAALSNNNASSNVNHGLRIAANDSAQVNATMSANMFDNNGVHGANIDTNNNANLTMTFSNNTFNGNGTDGANLRSRDTSTLVSTFSNNTFNGNGAEGIDAVSRDGSEMTLGVRGNTFVNDLFFANSRNSSNLCLQLLNNNSNLAGTAYQLQQNGASVFQFEPAVGNIGTISTTGTITNVPAGTCIFP